VSPTMYQAARRSRALVLAAAFMAGLSSGSVRAQTPGELARCRAISDRVARLNCYDALAERPARTTREPDDYQRISLVVLKLDLEALGGRLVEVKGRLSPFGVDDVWRLGTRPLDTSAVLVDFKAVPSEQRRWVLENCNSGCDAIVRGKVGHVLRQSGVIAATILAE